MSPSHFKEWEAPTIMGWHIATGEMRGREEMHGEGTPAGFEPLAVTDRTVRIY
jgi:hypothetical protein